VVRIRLTIGPSFLKLLKRTSYVLKADGFPQNQDANNLFTTTWKNGMIFTAGCGINVAIMLKNSFRTGWRTIKNNKAFSLINILGLALGMACSILILLWVQDERGIDNFHVDGDRLFSVYERQHVDGDIMAQYFTPALLPAEMKRVVPEIELASGNVLDYTYTFEARPGTGPMVEPKIIKEDGG
jgi:hypothetical protein